MLTKTQIERAKPPKAGRIVLEDHDLPGFGVRVFPSGQRSFILRYRLAGSRQKQTATIGTYPAITLPQARKRAEQLLATAKLGGDPQAARKAQRIAEIAQTKLLTVQGLVGRYEAALRAGTASSRRLKGRPASNGYIEDTLHYLEMFTRSVGRRVAASVARSDVVELLNDYISHPATHRQLHGAISRLYAWARQSELVTNNPAADVVTATAPARERVLALDELARIWDAAGQLDPLYRDLVRLLILTGQRRDEVAGMRWGEVQLGASLWVLPPVEGRNKSRRQHSIPLAPRALAILRARHTAFQHEPAADDLVLPTISRGGKTVTSVSGWNWLKRELDRLSGVRDWRLHDFRRSIVTHCAEHEVDVAVLDSLLNHASSATRGGVIGVYQRATLLKPIRSALELWERLVSDALSGGEVVRFPARG